VELESSFRGKVVLVTGAAGTIGGALVNMLLGLGVKEIRALDNDETDMFYMEEQYKDKSVTCILGDVRDRGKVEHSCKGVDIVFHAAALKHVPSCEYYPMEAVRTNILGVQNIIDGALRGNVERVIFTSSDKAVNPTSVMGTSKLMGEQLIKAANVIDKESAQIFSSTRFGNVLGSHGSVVPLFRNQIRCGGPVTLTEKAMTRFVMSSDDAVRLVLEAAVLAYGGDIFITKMPVIRIMDLAQIMVEELAPAYGYDPKDIEIREIGARPGEKLFEELMNVEEARRSIELERHFAVLPALSNIYHRATYDYPEILSKKIEQPYNSANEMSLSLEESRAYLKATGVLTTGLDS